MGLVKPNRNKVRTRYGSMGNLTPEERELMMVRIWEDMVTYRLPYETQWVEAHQMVRMHRDADTPYASDLRHPYAFSAVAATHSALYPALLSASPPFQIESPNPDHRPRNQQLETIIAAQLQNPDRSNFSGAYDKGLWDAVIFGTMMPHISFKSQRRRVGPFFEPTRSIDGDVLLDAKGEPIVEEFYEMLKVYHAPWVEIVDLWDSYAFPDGNRFMIMRDTNGRELLERSQGPNPMYDPIKINRMLLEESRGVRGEGRSRESEFGTFGTGDAYLRERDALAASIGAPSRHQEQWNSYAVLEDVMGRPYPIYHYSDDQFSGSYAVTSGGRWMELRWNHAPSVDGTNNIIPLVAHHSPQEVYGQSALLINRDLIRTMDKMFQAANDGAALTVHPMWAMSQSMRALNPELVTGPGVALTVPSAGENMQNHISRLDMPQTWVNAMQFVEHLKDGLDEGFAQSDFTRGQFPGGRKTAFLTAQVAQGSEGRMRMLFERIAGTFGQRLCKKFVALNSVHLSKADYAVYLGPHAAEFVPPTPREIVEEMNFIPKGSLDSANAQLNAGRWQGVVQSMVQNLPFLQLRPVNEAFRRWLEDIGADSVSRMMPEANDQINTEYMAALQAQKGGRGGGQAQNGGPNSPTDSQFLSNEIAGSFGQQAPPGPADGGRMNGAPQAANGF